MAAESLSNHLLLARNSVCSILVPLLTNTDTIAIGRYRILHVEGGASTKTREVYLFGLDGKPKPPQSVSQTLFDEQFNALKIIPAEYSKPYWMSLDDGELTPKSIISREYCWAIIRPLVEDPDATGIFLPMFRGKLINRRIEEIREDPISFIDQLPKALAEKFRSSNQLPKPTKKLIYDSLYYYWRDGQVKNSLLGRFPNCGGKGKRIPGEKKRGAPNLLAKTGHDVSAFGVNIDDQHLANIKFAFDTFKVGCNLSKADAYRRMQIACYSKIEERDGELVFETIPPEEYPTLTQFYYWCRIYEKEYAVRVADGGWKNFEQKKRQFSGRVSDNVHSPTEIFEIDASIANIWLVSRFNRHRLVGKPVVYFVIDRFSSMITGMHVALEGPSWNAARLALFWTMRDKVAYCAHYGIKIDADQWPSCEMPDMIVSDSGEMLSKAATVALNEKLQIDSEINAYGRPEHKPLVESRFRFVQGKTEWVQGAYRKSAKEWREDTGKDPRLDAVLTLREFTQILIYEVLDHNNNQRLSSLPYSMRMAGVRPFRRDVYLWGLANLRGPGSVRRGDDIEYLHRCLLPHKQVSITGGGIKFGGAYYVPTVGDHREILSLARVRSIPVRVFYDPNSPGEIWVEDDKGKDWSKWVWPKHEISKWEDCRAEEIQEAMAVADIEARMELQRERTESARKHQLSELIESRAKQQKNSSSGFKYKADRTKGIAEARAIEKTAARIENSTETLVAEPVTRPLENINKVVKISEARKSRRAKTLKFMNYDEPE